MHYAIKVKY